MECVTLPGVARAWCLVGALLPWAGPCQFAVALNLQSLSSNLIPQSLEHVFSQMHMLTLNF